MAPVANSYALKTLFTGELMISVAMQNPVQNFGFSAELLTSCTPLDGRTPWPALMLDYTVDIGGEVYNPTPSLTNPLAALMKASMKSKTLQRKLK